MGVMTAERVRAALAGDGAAMEPARNGRDDQHRQDEHVIREGAAMEPARNGRDDLRNPRPVLGGSHRRNGARP